MEIASEIEIYDSEYVEIDKKIIPYITSKQRTVCDLDDFQRAVIGKFEDLGFKVKMVPSYTNVPGVTWFDIVILARLEAKVFDYDRMVHEVTHNVLEDPTAETGFIDTSKAMREMDKPTPHQH